MKRIIIAVATVVLLVSAVCFYNHQIYLGTAAEIYFPKVFLKNCPEMLIKLNEKCEMEVFVGDCFYLTPSGYTSDNQRLIDKKRLSLPERKRAEMLIKNIAENCRTDFEVSAPAEMPQYYALINNTEYAAADLGDVRSRNDEVRQLAYYLVKVSGVSEWSDLVNKYWDYVFSK